MIETDMTACVLTCFRLYGYLQDKKLVKNMPKIQILPSLNSVYPIWHLNSKSIHLRWLSIVTYDWNDMPECVLTCFSVYGYVQNENFFYMNRYRKSHELVISKYKKYLNFWLQLPPPLLANLPSLCEWYTFWIAP